MPASWVYGPPAGERLELPIPPVLGVGAECVLGAVRVNLALKRAATVDLVLRFSDLRTAPWWSGGPDRPVAVTVATARESVRAGEHTLHLPLPAALRRGIGATVTAVTTLDGQHVAAAAPLTI